MDAFQDRSLVVEKEREGTGGHHKCLQKFEYIVIDPGHFWVSTVFKM
jgi:hypothetical protein